jgi:hypothetical protein
MVGSVRNLCMIGFVLEVAGHIDELWGVVSNGVVAANSVAVASVHFDTLQAKAEVVVEVGEPG